MATTSTQARVKQIPGRKGYYAYLSREEPNKKLQGESEAEAFADLARILKERKENVSPRLEGMGKTTLAYYAKKEIEYATITNAKGMADNITHDLTNRIIPFLEEKGVEYPSQLTRQHLEDYKQFRSSVSDFRVSSELNTMRRLIVRCITNNELPPDILSCFKSHKKGGILPKLPKSKAAKRVLSRAEYDKLYDATEERFKVFVRVLIGTGCRVEEPWHIETADLRAETKDGKTSFSLVINPKPQGWCECCPRGWKPKDHQERTIPISAETREAVIQFIAAMDKLPRHRKNIWGAIHKACTEAQIPFCSPHDLRRTWATWLLNSGVKIGKVSKLLGHDELITTLVYLGISLEDHEVDNLPI